MLECKICGFLTTDEEEMEVHFQSDEKHSELREQFCLKELVNELSVEELYKETYPKYERSKYKYPYGKVYTIKVTDNIYTNKEKSKFYDKESNAVYTADTLVRFLKSQERIKELQDFLKWKMKLHLSNIAKVTGVTIREKDLERMSEEELLARMFHEYFTHKDKRERLGQLVLENQRKAREFLSGKASVCPYCHLLIENTFLSKHYQAKKIMEQLGVYKTKAYKKFQENKGKNIKLSEVLGNLGYSGTYNSKPIFVPLNVLMHLALEHKERLSRILGKELKLNAKTVENYFLARKWTKPKRTKLSLSDLEVPSVEERLDDFEKEYLRWLKKKEN